jgi:hypothetical protein
MTNKIALVIAALAFLVSGVAIFKTPSAPLGGIGHQQKESFTQGLWAGNSRQFEVDNTGDVTAGDVTLTTSNTATSTLIVGCIQMYATSTASPGYLTFTSASTTGATGTSFLPSWTFGTCPH